MSFRHTGRLSLLFAGVLSLLASSNCFSDDKLKAAATALKTEAAVLEKPRPAEKTPEELILEDPVREHEKYRLRLKKYGPNAPFPEFRPVVDKLREKIESAAFQEVIRLHPDLGFELTEVRAILLHVNLKFTIEDPAIYPYSTPFDQPYPYRPTIDAIENALRLIDKVERLTNPKAVPLYHFDRYAYHRHSLLADPDVVIFPTLRNLTFQDLVGVRPVPIGFVGVVTETVRVDRHWQSPLDFWYHDLNHVRRMVAYIALRAAKRGAKTVYQKRAFYKEMRDFVRDELMPNIKALPKGSDPEAVSIRRLVRVIIFEILHETALTAEREVILDDLLRAPNVPQPFERMDRSAVLGPVDHEKLRTTTGNLASGAAMQLASGVSHEPILIRYIHDRALSLLANVYNKLNYGFFDDPEDPNKFVAPPEARKAEYVARAGQMVLEFLGHPKPPTFEELRALVLSKEGSPEKFVYKRLAAHEGDPDDVKGPITTEPLTADEVIAQVKALPKKVYSLFGYSLLDYEKKREVMGQIRRELETLDRKEWIINIGATEDGIGAAYEVAKVLGFETMGIVSTQALAYSGKFSKFVDRIYIVNDKRWGGFVEGTKELTPATRAYVETSSVISAHGGGENTAATLMAARERGKAVYFTPAEMSHAKATQVAIERKRAVPGNFRGAAEQAVIQLGERGLNICAPLLRESM